MGRQVEQRCANRLDGLTYLGRMVSSEVIKNHDRTELKAWTKDGDDEVNEAGLIHCTDHGPMAEHAVIVDGADYRDILPPVG